MQTTSTPGYPNTGVTLTEPPRAASCWSGIISGVFIILSVSAVLTILGAGLGFAIKSPDMDMSAAKTLGVVSIIWLIITQWIASSMGGYIAGRMRTRYVNVHPHEVFFRDTAHGFVAWAVATVITITLFASLGLSAVHGGARMGMHAMHHGMMSGEMGEHKEGQGDRVANPMNYYSDSLFRAPTPTSNPADPAVKDEANRILMKSLKDGSMSEDDKNYLAQLVAARTGIPDADAHKRVDDVVARQNVDETQMRELADNARKTASILSLCIALSMMVGAFVASISAALGGNIRDKHN